MQADFEYSTLSLSQRAHIIAKQADEVYSALIIIILILGILVILNLITTPLVDIVDIILFTAIAAYIVIVIVYAVFGLKHLTRLLKGWNKDYLQQSYILVFDTTVPKGNTNAEKIFNLATAVFPELGGFIPAFWPAPINRLN